jgi:hypothetical protein
MNKACSTIFTFKLLFLIGALLGCKDDSSQNPEKEERPLTELQRSTEYAGELYALSSGGAYLVGDGAIFYIQNDKAIKVQGLPSETILSEIHPLADGNAIYINALSSPAQLFLLTKHKATPITESSEEPSEVVTKASDAASLYFVENQRLKRKLKEAEEASEFDSEISGDMDYSDRY